MTDLSRYVGIDELALNDPNLGRRSSIDLEELQDDIHGGIDNLIDVWQSNVTVDVLDVYLTGYQPSHQDDARLIQPILEHLIRNRPQMRKLSLRYGREPAILGQFMLTAAETPFIEELDLFGCARLQTSHLDRFFRLNRNIKRLELSWCELRVGGDERNTAGAADDDTLYVLETLCITMLTLTEGTAREFIDVFLRPNRNIVELELGSVHFDSDSLLAPAFFAALVGETVKRLKIRPSTSCEQFEIIMNAATNIEVFSMPFSHHKKLKVLARVLPKMQRLLELNISCTRPLDCTEEVKHAFVRSVEQHANLTTMTLEIRTVISPPPRVCGCAVVATATVCSVI